MLTAADEHVVDLTYRIKTEVRTAAEFTHRIKIEIKTTAEFTYQKGVCVCVEYAAECTFQGKHV